MTHQIGGWKARGAVASIVGPKCCDVIHIVVVYSRHLTVEAAMSANEY